MGLRLVVGAPGCRISMVCGYYGDNDMNKIAKVYTIISAVISVITLAFFIYTKFDIIAGWYQSVEDSIVAEYNELDAKMSQIKFIMSGDSSDADVSLATESGTEQTAQEEELMYAALRVSSEQYLRQTYPDLSDDEIEIMIDGFIVTAKNGPFAWTINTAQNAIVSYYDEAYQSNQQNQSEDDSE